MSPKPQPATPPPPALSHTCPHARFHADPEECAKAAPEPWWTSHPDHMKGWEAFGVTGQEPTVRRLGIVTFGKHWNGPATTEERPGTEPFGAGEVRLGVAGIHLSTHADHPTGAFLHVVGTTEQDVAARWRTVDAELARWLPTLWPTSRSRR